MTGWLISAILIFVYLMILSIIALVVPLEKETQVQNKEEFQEYAMLETLVKHSSHVPAVRLKNSEI